MATQTVINQQTISTKLVVTLFMAMIMAFAFVAFLTNMIVNSKVNAAYQNNPVTVAAPTQTNAAPAASTVACVVPAASTSASAPGSVSTASGGTLYLPWSGGYALAGSYSSSNSSIIETNSSNTFINDSYNTANLTATDNRWSGNTLIANNGNTDNRNSGNTTNTTSTVTTNTDNSNNSTSTNVQDSNNSTTLNTLIDNSQENNTAVGVGGLGIAVVVD